MFSSIYEIPERLKQTKDISGLYNVAKYPVTTKNALLSLGKYSAKLCTEFMVAVKSGKVLDVEFIIH
jgi:hypothetical protein